VSQQPYEIWEVGPHSAARRLADSLRRRAWSLGRRFASAFHPEPAPPAGSGPCFEVSGFEVPFEELERIVFHPQVIRAVEQAPLPPRATAPLPPPRLPRGVERFAAPRRARPAKVFDVFPFSLELDVLELRLRQLEDVVDVFVAVEAPRGFGGPRKPLFLSRNLARFDRFRSKLVRLVVATNPWDAGLLPARRTGTDWAGESAFREALWREVRRLDIPEDAVVLTSDVDEVPSRHVVHWLREYAVPLPVRLRLKTLRYGFRWFDTETVADVVVLSPAQFPLVDEAPQALRQLTAPTLGLRGGSHLTSFLHPLALVAKFALTTDWDPGILPYLRNDADQTERMMRRGEWFGRRMTGYDAQADPQGLLPEAAVSDRARYATFWDR
jgi:hypothetical protein